MKNHRKINISEETRELRKQTRVNLNTKIVTFKLTLELDHTNQDIIKKKTIREL